MSNNQDEPDEYEVIFDDPNSTQETFTKIEISDGEIIDAQENSDAGIVIEQTEPSESQEIPEFAESSESSDSDIEDGIFAPERREMAAAKKSSSLMWAVSLLAFVGVGAFVYVSNPNIVAKVTQNMGEASDVTLPNEIVTTEEQAFESVPQNMEQASIENTSSEAPITPSEMIMPNASSEPQVEHQVDPLAPTEDLVTTAPAPNEDESISSVMPTAVTTADDMSEPEMKTATIVVNESPVVESMPNVTTDMPEGSMPAVSVQPETQPEVQAEVKTDVSSIVEATPDLGPTPATLDAQSVAVPPTLASADAPADDNKEQVDENIVDTVDKPEQKTFGITAIVQAPESSTPENKMQVADAMKKAEKEDSKKPAPVIVNSKEEQKVLDDANLDKYFDSPSGKMMRDIPAPSMDPSKGGRESIIIVNKKGQKPAQTHSSKSSGNIVIKTTNLDSQIVSANRALKLGRYEAAKEMYDELYRLNPRDGQILSGRAVLLQKMGMEGQAISAYEELLGIYPDNADAIVNLAGLIRKTYPAEALNKLLDLHVKHPDNVNVTAQLGVAYADSGNYSDALRYLNDAALMDQKNALHFYNMAVVSEKASKPEQAVKYYEKALEVDAIYGEGNRTISKVKIYDRLAQIRGN